MEVFSSSPLQLFFKKVKETDFTFIKVLKKSKLLKKIFGSS